MGGFVKETRSLHPAEGTVLLTMEEVWGGGRRVSCWLAEHSALEVPLPAQCRPRRELPAFRSPASGEWLGYSLANSFYEVIYSGLPTLHLLPKLEVWEMGCIDF